MTLLTPEWKEKRRRRNAHMLTFFQRNNIACGTGVAGGRDVASCCCIDCRRHQVGRVIGDGSPLTPFGQEIHVRCSWMFVFVCEYFVWVSTIVWERRRRDEVYHIPNLAGMWKDSPCVWYMCVNEWSRVWSEWVNERERMDFWRTAEDGDDDDGHGETDIKCAWVKRKRGRRRRGWERRRNIHTNGFPDSPDDDDFLFDDKLLLEDDSSRLLRQEGGCDQSNHQDQVYQTHDWKFCVLGIVTDQDLDSQSQSWIWKVLDKWWTILSVDQSLDEDWDENPFSLFIWASIKIDMPLLLLWSRLWTTSLFFEVKAWHLRGEAARVRTSWTFEKMYFRTYLCVSLLEQRKSFLCETLVSALLPL